MTSDQESHAHAIAPDLEREVEGYLAHAASALDADERLELLSRALALDPGHPLAVRRMTEALRGGLAADPFLAYVSEDERLYLVRTSDGRELAIPKRRQPTRSDSARGSSTLRIARRWLACAGVGMIPAGLGALLCAPVACALALVAIRQAGDELERRRAIVAGVGAALLFAVASALLLLLLLHV